MNRLDVWKSTNYFIILNVIELHSNRVIVYGLTNLFFDLENKYSLCERWTTIRFPAFSKPKCVFLSDPPSSCLLEDNTECGTIGEVYPPPVQNDPFEGSALQASLDLSKIRNLQMDHFALIRYVEISEIVRITILLDIPPFRGQRISRFLNLI